MNLTALVLKRPIATTMIFLALGLIGILTWQRLPLELMPNLNYPQLTIITSCENMAPLDIEALITKPIEAAIGTVSKVRRINSISREGLSLVTLDFEWGTKMNYAALDVREKLDQIRDLLPKEVVTPMIIRYDPGSLPIMTLAVKGDSISFQDLEVLVSEKIKREIEREAGVASARLSGSREREIQVTVNQGGLLARDISISSLVSALKDSNLNYPGGKIVRHNKELRLRTTGEFKQVQDINKVGILPQQRAPSRMSNLPNNAPPRSRTPVFINDLANVEDGFKEESSIARLDGQASLILAVFKMADFNTVEVVDRVQEKVAALNRDYKGRLHILIAQDQGQFIKQAVSQLEEAALVGGLLAFGVLLGFLANLRSALAILTAIPISVLTTFSLMYMTGISLNMMSLGGLALGIGMLVDNGVVVLENIRRHQEVGELPASQAIVHGTNEVKLAITASTMAHIVVFLPVIFVRGIASQFMYQIALTISFSLLASLAVALFLNPMLVSLERSKPLTRARWMEKSFWGKQLLQERLDRLYNRLLTFALQHSRYVLVIALLLLVIGALIFTQLGRELLPTLDQRQFLLRVHTSPNTSFGATDEHLKEIEKIILAHPGVQTVITQFGYNPKEQYEKILQEKEPRVGQIMVTLKPRKVFPQSAAKVIQELRTSLDNIAGTMIEYTFPQSLSQWLGQKSELPELLLLQGPDLEILDQLSQDILDKLQNVKGIVDLEAGLKKYGEESRIVLDRERAAAFGLSIKEIGETLKASIQGEVATQFRQAERDIDVRVQLIKSERQTLPDLSRIFVYSKQLKTDIPLTAVARFETGPGLREIFRHDQVRTVVVRGNVIGRRLGDVQNDIDQAVKPLALPEGYTLRNSGEAVEMNKSFNMLIWAFMLSIVLVYMILAGQFESLLHPLIILFAIPFALIGVSLALGLTGWGISLGVYFGAIMLGGIVVNNSILLVDYINTLRSQQYELKEAVIMGSRARLRPVVMTTLTTTLGLLPLVIYSGEGAELRIPLALTVIGGLLTSTLLTLVVVPLFYLKSEEFLRKYKRIPVAIKTEQPG